MITWLHIDAQPALQLYQDARALPYLDSAARSVQVLQSVDPLRAGVAGETANITVVLANRHGRATRLLASPPLGRACTLYGRRGGVSEALFAGVLTDIELDADTARLTVLA